jgi:hypothetical protein
MDSIMVEISLLSKRWHRVGGGCAVAHVIAPLSRANSGHERKRDRRRHSEGEDRFAMMDS